MHIAPPIQPCSLAPTLTGAHSFLPPRTLANTTLRARERLGTPSSAPSTLDPARSPSAARALERVRLLLAEHPPPPPAWPGQVHGAAYPGYGASNGRVVSPTGEALHREKGRQWVRARRPTHHVRHRIARRRPHCLVAHPGGGGRLGAAQGTPLPSSSGRASHHGEVIMG